MPYPKPRFFIIRPGVEKFTAMGELVVQPSTIVPLVAIDLLPEWLEVDGVARALQPSDTADMINLGMYHAGIDTYRLKFHRVISGDTTQGGRDETNGGADESCAGSASSHSSSTAAAPTPQTESASPAAAAASNSAAPPKASDRPPNPAAGPGPAEDDDRCSPHPAGVGPPGSGSGSGPTCRPRSASPTSRTPKNLCKADAAADANATAVAAAAAAAATATTATTKTPPPPPTPPPLPPVCQYWCITGTCRWGQICRYRHVMPTTTEGLASAGLDEHPAWWLATVGELQVPPAEEPQVPAEQETTTSKPLPAKKLTKTQRKKLRYFAERSKAVVAAAAGATATTNTNTNTTAGNNNDQAAKPSPSPSPDKSEGPETARRAGTEAETRSHCGTEEYLIEM